MSELHQPAENAENAARGHINKGIFRLSPFYTFLQTGTFNSEDCRLAEYAIGIGTSVTRLGDF